MLLSIKIMSNTWNNLAAHFRRRFGCRGQKIPLDVGGSCPNRDGTLSNIGCTFCNILGSGSGFSLSGMSITEQWEHWRKHFYVPHRPICFIAYLQSFSNTYGSLDKFSSILAQIMDLEGLSGISVATRPDCLTEEKLKLIADMFCLEKWVELGVQTLRDETLMYINRRHTAKCSEDAIIQVAKSGIQVCAHVMFGLPGETPEDMLKTVDRLNALPVHGIKFHNVYVERYTVLEKEYIKGLYTPLTERMYIELIVESLYRLRPDIVIHRVVADPPSKDLVAPEWAQHKSYLVRTIERHYRLRLPKVNSLL